MLAPERKEELTAEHYSRRKRKAWIAAIGSLAATALVLLGLYMPLGPFGELEDPPRPRETVTLEDIRPDTASSPAATPDST